MKELIVATANKGKINEFDLLFKDLSLPIKLISFQNLNFFEDVPETGNSFKENAFQKAEFVFKKFNIPVVSDDSGLEIKILNNQPGVLSARYAGIEKDDAKNRKLVLDNLKDIKDRDARFVCCLCYYDGNKKKIFEGFLEGKINTAEVGENGFGYDSVFIPKGYSKTMAELSMEEKNKLSHRAIAMKLFVEFLRNS
ncbi:MAG: RdgB/HAM1 family non-canonical purine NTP pyrophosphatase [Bacteroidota bacterium]